MLNSKSANSSQKWPTSLLFDLTMPLISFWRLKQEELHGFLYNNDLFERRTFIYGSIKEVTIKGNDGPMKYASPLSYDNIEEEA